MHEVDVGVGQDLLKVGVAGFHAEGVANVIELLARALADGVHVGVGVLLVDGDELGSKTKADDGDVDLAVGVWHGKAPWVNAPPGRKRGP